MSNPETILYKRGLSNFSVYVALISVGFVLRPTVAIFWLPLVVTHAFRLLLVRSLLVGQDYLPLYFVQGFLLEFFLPLNIRNNLYRVIHLLVD